MKTVKLQRKNLEEWFVTAPVNDREQCHRYIHDAGAAIVAEDLFGVTGNAASDWPVSSDGDAAANAASTAGRPRAAASAKARLMSVGDARGCEAARCNADAASLADKSPVASIATARHAALAGAASSALSPRAPADAGPEAGKKSAALWHWPGPAVKSAGIGGAGGTGAR